MVTFEKAAEALLLQEGGHASHPADKGGETMYGVSDFSDGKIDGTIDLDGDGRGDVPVQQLTRAQAVQFYRTHYWDVRYEMLPTQILADKILDLTVHFGKMRGIRLLQEALRACGYSQILADGNFGPQTLMGCKLMPVVPLIKAIRARQARAYVDRVLQDQTQLVFLDGWLRRAVA